MVHSPRLQRIELKVGLRFLVLAALTVGMGCDGDDGGALPPDASPDAPIEPPPPTPCEIHCEACAPGSSTCIEECGYITIDCQPAELDALATCHLNGDQACGLTIALCTDQIACWVSNLTCGNNACEAGDDVNCPADCNPPACDHSECEAGTALDVSCTTCTATVCGNDAYCCESAWDNNCVEAAIFECGICL